MKRFLKWGAITLVAAAVIIGGFALRFAFSIWQELLALAIVPTAFMVGVFSFWPETDLGEELYAGFFIFFAICLAINKRVFELSPI